MGFVVSFSSPSSSCSLPAQGVFHCKNSFMNVLNMGPSHELQFFKKCFSGGFFPWATVLQLQVVPMRVPLHGPHFLTENPLLPGIYTGWKCFTVCPPAPGQDPPWTEVWLSAPVWTSMLCSSPAAGESLPQQPEHLLPLVLPWHWCLQGSHILSLLSPCCCSAVFPFLKCVIIEEPPLLLLASASGGQWQVHLGAGWNGSVKHSITES